MSVCSLLVSRILAAIIPILNNKNPRHFRDGD